MEHVDVIIVGAGQAGLAVSHELSAAGVEHVVLERGRVGETWRHRWDTFCLVTPNWTMRLPGRPYSGPDPHGFMPRDEIVAALEDYAGAFAAPVREGVTAAGVESSPDGGFIVHTTAGDLSSRALVLATGAFQRPHRPAAADTLPTGLPQMDVDVYRNEGALPPGRVLVVGSGQSGAQISEELREAGREVVLACGKAAWVRRRLGGHDIVWWLAQVGFFDQTIGVSPDAGRAPRRQSPWLPVTAAATTCTYVHSRRWGSLLLGTSWGRRAVWPTSRRICRRAPPGGTSASAS